MKRVLCEAFVTLSVVLGVIYHFWPQAFQVTTKQEPQTYAASFGSPAQATPVATEHFMGLLCDHVSESCKTSYPVPNSNGYSVRFVSADTTTMNILAGYNGQLAGFTIRLNEGLWFGGENSVKLIVRQPGPDQPLVAEVYSLK